MVTRLFLSVMAPPVKTLPSPLADDRTSGGVIDTFAWLLCQFTLFIYQFVQVRCLLIACGGLLLLSIECVRLESAPQIRFVNVTAEAGIRFQHQNGRSEKHFIVETLGSGVAVLDYDSDGWVDLYFVNSGVISQPDENGQNALYRNLGDGTFADVTLSSGTGDTGFGVGVTVGDYDNDGDPDLYITNAGSNVLYCNNGDGTFTDVAETAGVGHNGCGTGCAFFDFDLDSDLDLYLANYGSVDQMKTLIDDNGYQNPIFYNGAVDVLYQNRGDGTFTKMQTHEWMRLQEPTSIFHDARGLSVVAADFNHDSWPDIYVANDKSKNLYFHNNGDGTFTESATILGIGYDGFGQALAGMGIATGDYDRDGKIDIFVTNFAYEFNNLYHCESPTGAEDLFFTDVTVEADLGDPSYLYVGWGTTFFDADNDGDLDLFVANGHIMNDQELDSDTLTYAQPDQLFENRGEGKFAEISIQSGDYFSQHHVARGAVHLDYDNDGDLDLLISNSGQPPILLRNYGGNLQNWLEVFLCGSAVGATLTIRYGDQTQVRQVPSSGSYCSVNDGRIHFGLGRTQVVDQIEIQWGRDQTKQLNHISANQQLTIELSPIPKGQSSD